MQILKIPPPRNVQLIKWECSKWCQKESLLNHVLTRQTVGIQIPDSKNPESPEYWKFSVCIQMIGLLEYRYYGPAYD